MVVRHGRAEQDAKVGGESKSGVNGTAEDSLMVDGGVDFRKWEWGYTMFEN